MLIHNIWMVNHIQCGGGSCQHYLCAESIICVQNQVSHCITECLNDIVDIVQKIGRADCDQDICFSLTAPSVDISGKDIQQQPIVMKTTPATAALQSTCCRWQEILSSNMN